MIHNYPYTNFHDLNLDWIIEKVKTAIEGSYNPDNPPPYPVTSVNGKTGAVLIPVPVQSVNGQTGNVVIAIPVTSVNGKTGAVNVPFEDPDAGQLRLQQKMQLGTAWGIERDLLDDNEVTGFTIDTEGTGAEDPPDLFVYVKRNNQIYQVRLLTSKDIPESSGVVSVNGMTGVVTLTADNVLYDRSTSVKSEIALKLNADEVIDNLNTESSSAALSAKQGVILNRAIDKFNNNTAFNVNIDNETTGTKYIATGASGHLPPGLDNYFMLQTYGSGDERSQFAQGVIGGESLYRTRTSAYGWGDWKQFVIYDFSSTTLGQTAGNVSVSHLTLYRKNGTAFITGYIECGGTVSVETRISTIPEGYRPPVDWTVIGRGQSSSTAYNFNISNTGAFTTKDKPINESIVRISISYPINN